MAASKTNRNKKKTTKNNRKQEKMLDSQGTMC